MTAPTGTARRAAERIDGSYIESKRERLKHTQWVIQSAIDTEAAAIQAENERLRERCEELEVNRKSMRERVIDLQAEHDWVRKKLGVPLGTRMTEGDPCVCGTLHVWESRKDMIPMYETSLKRSETERDKLRRKTIDLEGMLATAHEAGEKLRRERCRKFAVTDGSKQGTCYSFFDHFDVWWEDGTNDLGILDLSDKGIRKTE